LLHLAMKLAPFKGLVPRVASSKGPAEPYKRLRNAKEEWKDKVKRVSSKGSLFFSNIHPEGSRKLKTSSREH